ncbi:MAG TPA: 6-hydroxymethylpterin diphosphokinase MptE-like protein [Anaerolineales bacterium]|jgi:hypothetical protein
MDQPSSLPTKNPDSLAARLIYRIKPRIPRSLWQLITAPYWWWYNRARHQVAGVVHPARRRSIRELRELKGAHAGERCFIMGNGPSLAKMDLSMLANEVTFGMNRIYLLFPELSWRPSYYVAVNSLVIEQCADEIKALTMPKFVTWRARRWMLEDPTVVFLDTDYTDPPTFSRDVSGRVFEGSTVTYVALQLAYHLGFRQVILIGVDHIFRTTGPPNVTITSQGDDRDHFATGYFGQGFRWQLPDLAASERAYQMARQAFEADGRQVLDATVGGKLTVFPKVSFADCVAPSGD